MPICWIPPELPPEFEEARKTAERLWGDRKKEDDDNEEEEGE